MPTPGVLLLPDFTPIPTYAPPLYIPPTEEVRVGPTEVATPWPTPVDRRALAYRLYAPYVHFDWAYVYPFLRVPPVPTPTPSPLYVWAQRVDAVLLTGWRILPSFMCLILAMLLGVVRLAVRRRGR